MKKETSEHCPVCGSNSIAVLTTCDNVWHIHEQDRIDKEYTPTLVKADTSTQQNETVGNRFLDLLKHDKSWAVSQISTLPKQNDGTEKAYYDGVILGLGMAKKRYLAHNAPNVAQLEKADTRETETVSKITGSEIGSGHWFNTLMASIKHAGEYLQDNGAPPKEETLKAWGALIYERSNELLDWFASQHTDTAIAELKAENERILAAGLRTLNERDIFIDKYAKEIAEYKEKVAALEAEIESLKK